MAYEYSLKVIDSGRPGNQRPFAYGNMEIENRENVETTQRGRNMTTWLTAVLGILMIGLPLTSGAEKNPAAPQAQKMEQAAAPARSNLSQGAIENVSKREEARKQRDRKMKARAKNVQSSPKNSNNLFRRSK